MSDTDAEWRERVLLRLWWEYEHRDEDGREEPVSESLLQSADLPSRFWVALRELGRDTLSEKREEWPLETVILALEEAEL